MIDLKVFLLGMSVGIIFPFIQDIFTMLSGFLNLVLSYFTNKQTLHASKVQSQIDNLNSEEISTNAIGFQVPTEQEYIGDEDE